MQTQQTYRIRHQGVESTPHSINDLRHMWKTGQIDSTTMFRRGDATVWIGADDLLPLLEAREEQSTADLPRQKEGMTTLGGNSSKESSTAPGYVRLVSVKIPFREVLVLVLKFYLAVLVLAGAGVALWTIILRVFR